MTNKVMTGDQVRQHMLDHIHQAKGFIPDDLRTLVENDADDIATELTQFKDESELDPNIVGEIKKTIRERGL